MSRDFKQENPKDQATVILGSIKGWLSNLKDGVSTPQKVAHHIEMNIAELETLHKF